MKPKQTSPSLDLPNQGRNKNQQPRFSPPLSKREYQTLALQQGVEGTTHFILLNSVHSEGTTHSPLNPSSQTK